MVEVGDWLIKKVFQKDSERNIFFITHEKTFNREDKLIILQIILKFKKTKLFSCFK